MHSYRRLYVHLLHLLPWLHVSWTLEGDMACAVVKMALAQTNIQHEIFTHCELYICNTYFLSSELTFSLLFSLSYVVSVF